MDKEQTLIWFVLPVQGGFTCVGVNPNQKKHNDATFLAASPRRGGEGSMNSKQTRYSKL